MDLFGLPPVVTDVAAPVQAPALNSLAAPSAAAVAHKVATTFVKTEEEAARRHPPPPHGRCRRCGISRAARYRHAEAPDAQI
jgi:hypothetical protein